MKSHESIRLRNAGLIHVLVLPILIDTNMTLQLMAYINNKNDDIKLLYHIKKKANILQGKKCVCILAFKKDIAATICILRMEHIII